MNRLNSLQWALASASALVLAACSPATAAQSGAPQGPPSVQTLTVQLTTVPNAIDLSGRARAFAEAEIRPQVTGIVAERLFTEGEAVKKGQALYRLDASEYASAVESAKASLMRAEAAAGSARTTAARYERLAAINAVSQQEYEQANAEAKQAEADIALQRAQLNRAQIDLGRTRITAPISGQIGRSDVTAGALVTQNQANAMATVVQLDPINIDLTASAVRLLSIRQQIASGKIATVDGTIPVTVLFEDGTAYAHPGRLEFSEVSVDEAAGTVAVRVVVPNPDGLLLPGMFLRASFSAGAFENVVTVPQSLVSRTAKGEPTVLVVADDNTVERRVVTVDGQSGNAWIVSSGLAAGDKIITSNLQSIETGMTVTTVPASESAEGTPANAGARGGIQ
ncbi:MAG: efflux RND transporter periplasmic adaptor subunit [Hyphomonas sp.]|uniref:efflux RND transporter periplasmic adaptor subunit n=1 Tax=Hyphomonas sp. TaxID=87 RepID=UPI000CAEBAC8|nr:efflux RND transporter periplasmic adaptor subunit [Hyphomonas sp.]MBA3067008.1 efflux RND transporter periplasmic adaptor subunit [Hyphomonas sp.]MBU4062291.1 efflux RND transporter periplasmic adaptor subunit [Alphaproteobacteria bacterium]MBU4163202.1 efflux RND transporter periplasmic adaptor subunit [Alphaproteobacteria bacterium]PKP79734.1 MAG: efflux transporter periplasmic adaptor subunit [Alphaproteobacteria bacterium HGW-Alphaproteobacteria-18]